MKTRLTILLGSVLLLAGCVASPDYGYHYGYASSDYGSCGWGGGCSDGYAYGPSSYGSYGPSFSLNLNLSDRDRGDRGRDFQAREPARAGAGGERHDRQVGRGETQARREGGDRRHDQDHDR